MLRKRLVVSAAVAPLLLMGWAAHAETTISSGTSTPVATATANNGAADSITITSAGSVKRTDAGAAVTENSSNDVSNAGAITTDNVDNTTGLLITGGNTGVISNTGSISITESSYSPADTNGDGILDDPYAKGTTRFGIQMTGAHTGNITSALGSTITVNGNNSSGINLFGGPLTGNFESSGAVTVTGNNGYGVRLGDVTGNVRVQGTVSTLGMKTTGVALDGNVTGAVVFEGTVGTTAFRYTTRTPLETDRAKIGAVNGVDHPTGTTPYDTNLFSGPAIRIGGSVTGGVLLDIQPTISTTNTDVNGNGILDADETSSVITTVGGAPGLLVGSDTQAITLGVVGTGDANYGLIARGSIVAAGVYDGVSVTDVQLGGSTGQSTVITNGAVFSGTLSGTAYEANVTAVHVTAGLQTGTLLLSGTTSLTGISNGLVKANVGANGNTSVTAVQIDAGANVGVVRNTGAITLAGRGNNVDTVFLRDLSGSVGLVENSGKITATQGAILSTDFATTPTTTSTVNNGNFTAVDVSAATGNVVVRQLAPATHISTDTTDANGNGVYDADEPEMRGDILFGAHNDTLDVQSGTVIGDISFGAGNDSLLISGAAQVGGAISDSDGHLTIGLDKGNLTITNADTINATSLTATNSSALTFTADPANNNQVTQLHVGTATLSAGTRIGLRFDSLLVTDTRFTVIQAGTLTASTLNEDLLGNSPFLYVTNAGIDAANNSVYVNASRRTAEEMGLNKEQTASYNAVYNALFKDDPIRDAFLSQTTKAGFTSLYNQMLPNTGAGIFSALEQADQATTDAIAARPDPHQRYGPDSFWLQEIDSRIQRNTGDTEGSNTNAFGFVGGYESMGDGGALGLTLSYVSAQERASSAQVGAQSSVTEFEGGAYWRGYAGPLTFNVRGGLGYVNFSSDRTLVLGGDTNGDGVNDTTVLDRDAAANWSGFTASMGGDIAYDQHFGRYYVRPSAGIDFLYLNEGAHSESGGGTGLDLSYAKRSSSRLSGEVMVSFGTEFGRDSWWRPELRLGYRARLAGKLGDTVTNYVGGAAFTTAADSDSGGAVVVGFSLKAGTPMSYLALEGDSETSTDEIRYLLRLVGRVMF